MIISENIPSTNRGKLVLGAFGFQALGALGGTGVGYFVLVARAGLSPGAGCTPPRYSRHCRHHRPLLHRRKRQLAVASAARTTRPSSRSRGCLPASRNIRRTSRCAAAHAGRSRQPVKPSFAALFNNRNRRATIFASVPWFIQDLGTYGIGIFTPMILAAAIGGGSDHVRSLSDLIADDILAAKGAALINVLLIVGIVFAVVLADRFGRIWLQIIGFIGCAVGLFLASFSDRLHRRSTKIALIFAGFMLFNFMTNLGPNAQTYLLAGEVFPTEVRGMGAGFAAAFAKIGAVATAFLFPILLVAIGTARAALRSDRHLDSRRGGHLDVPHRDDWREPRRDRPVAQP